MRIREKAKCEFPNLCKNGLFQSKLESSQECVINEGLEYNPTAFTF